MSAVQVGQVQFFPYHSSYPSVSKISPKGMNVLCHMCLTLVNVLLILSIDNEYQLLLQHQDQDVK